MAGLAQAQGSLTIVDFNDAPMLTQELEVTSGSAVQLYDINASDDNYRQGTDWTKAELKLVPRLYISGTDEPIEACASESYNTVVTYEKNLTGTWEDITPDVDPGFYYIDNGTNYINKGIKITSNILSPDPLVVDNSGTIRATITYTNTYTNQVITMTASQEIRVQTTSAGAVTLLLYTPKGTIFSNAATSVNESKTVEATLVRGIVDDSDNLIYKWELDDVPIGDNLGANTIARDSDGNIVTIAGDETLSNTVTVSPEQVYGKALLTCTVYDSAMDPDTKYKESEEFIDLVDPVQVELYSNIGTAFKIGQQNNARISAIVKQSGADIAVPSTGGFLWSLNDKSGFPVSFTSGAAFVNLSKTGNTTSGSMLIQNLNTTDLKVGYEVHGVGIPAFTRINKIDGALVYLSKPATVTGNNVSLKIILNGKLDTDGTTWIDDTLDEIVTASNVPYIDIVTTDINVRGTIVCRVMY